MPTETVSLNTLLNWSPAKRVRTAKGEKDLRTAAPTEKFWQLWRSDKASLQAAGISVGKSQQTGQWEACWWQNPPVEEMAQRAESREQSRSTGAETAIDIPVPDGLAYLPYQRAGIAYASARDACLIGDEMGLGKTVQAIGVSNMDPSTLNNLVVVPASLKINWLREIKKWQTIPGRIHIINGGKGFTEQERKGFECLKSLDAHIRGKGGEASDNLFSCVYVPSILRFVPKSCRLSRVEKSSMRSNPLHDGEVCVIDADAPTGMTLSGRMNAPFGVNECSEVSATDFVNGRDERTVWTLLTNLNSKSPSQNLKTADVNSEILAHSSISFASTHPTHGNTNLIDRQLSTPVTVFRVDDADRLIRVSTLLDSALQGMVVPSVFTGSLSECDLPTLYALRYLLRQFFRDNEFLHADLRWLIINYDILNAWRSSLDVIGPFDLLICDEIHQCKNPKAQRTKALFGDKEKPPIQAKRRVFLSGTPILNRPCELYTLVKALDPNGLGKSWSGYHVRYCAAVQTRFGWDVSGASHLDELQNRLRETFMVRRLKSDVLKELPAKTRQVVSLPVTPSMAALLKREGAAYDEWQEAQEAIDALNEMGEDYADDVRRLRVEMETAFTEMSALRHEVALAKVPAVLEQVTDTLEGGASKLILFAHHLDVIDALMEGLAAYNPVKVTGSMSGTQRQASVDAFQNDANCRVFVGNIRAAGVGLTLTAASLVAFAELDWVPGNLCQAEDRAHRIGQTDNVLVQHLVFDGSLDAIMAKTLISKQTVIDRALDTGSIAPAMPESQVSEITVTMPEPPAARIHSEETIKVVQDAVRYMTGMDSDHCQENNGIGWNGGDSKPGHWLASLPTLNDKQVTLAIRMLRKYAKTQLKGFGKNTPWS